jgi:hypothetical protein
MVTIIKEIRLMLLRHQVWCSHEDNYSSTTRHGKKGIVGSLLEASEAMHSTSMCVCWIVYDKSSSAI